MFSFTVRDFSRIITKMGIRATKNECYEFLAINPFVFQLTQNTFITRCAVFTGRYFSFKPTRKEVEQNIFVAGGRCIPFADPEMFPSMFTFFYNGKELPKMTGEFDAGAAADLHALYGVEFASQYIASDPVNKDIELSSNDFELPPYVKLTGNSLQPLVEQEDFKYGDRLLCKIIDWDLGQIEITVQKRESKALQINSTDVERANWYSFLESALLESFNIVGPRSSIEEQLAEVFLEHMEVLSQKHCGSVEELLETSNYISYAQFGVETRIWKSGEEVPAVGKWNEIPDEEEYQEIASNLLNNLAVPDFIIDAAISEQLFLKEYDEEKLLATILPESLEMSGTELVFFLMHLNSRHAAVKKMYNWFADFPISKIRERALSLYSKANSLIFDIDHNAENLESYPQQSLIILSQIFSHVIRILEMISLEPTAALNDEEEIILSLEGMELNFECVHEELFYIIEKDKSKDFTIKK